MGFRHLGRRHREVAAASETFHDPLDVHIAQRPGRDKDAAVFFEEDVGRLDAADNGDFSMLGTMPTFASTLNNASNPASRSDYFMKAVEMYKSYLEASIDIAWTKHKDKEYVKKCADEAIAAGKKYIFFDRACEADFSFLSGLGIKFVATPNDEPDTDDKFEAMSLRCEEREFFPEIINGNHVWGLRKEELSNASGISGMEFIHKDGFFATTKTRSAMQALLDLV